MLCITGAGPIKRLKALGRVDLEVLVDAWDTVVSFSSSVEWREDILLVILILIKILGLLFWHSGGINDVSAGTNLRFNQSEPENLVMWPQKRR